MNPEAESSQQRASHKRWGVICMLLSIAFFSINSLTLNYVSVANVSPWVALLFRASVGLMIVATVFRKGHQLNYRRAITDRLLASRGMLGVAGTIAYYFTIPALGAGKATLISNMYVVIAALMAVWFLKESFGLGKFAGNILAIVGLAMLLTRNEELKFYGLYEGLAVFGAVVAAATVIVIRELTKTESTAQIYTSQCIYVLLGAMPLGIYELCQHPVSYGLFAWLIIAGISATVGQLAMTEGFRHLTVAVGGAFQICVPVVIAIGGVILFNEPFTATQILGATLILAGCYWVMVNH